MSENLIENLRGILNDKIHVQHNDGEVTGYAHSYCNEKVRENKSKITVIAHNLFTFDFFFLLKGIIFGSIGNQVMFIDTIKYFQQSLGALASNLTNKEKASIRKE